MRTFKILLATLAFVAFMFQSCSEDTPFFSEPNGELQQFEGILYVAISDNVVNDQFIHGGYEVFLEESATGEIYTIDFEESEIDNYFPKSGQAVRVEGELAEERLMPKSVRYLEQDQIDSRDPGNGNGGGPGGGNGGGPGGGKGASILVVMVSDNASTPNCTAAEMEYQLVGSDNPVSTANFFTTSSKGKFTIGSVTTTEVTIPSISCGVSWLSYAVDPLLEQQGFSVNNYDHIMYVTAPVCGYGGQATLNGKIVHNAYCTWVVVSPHELGHNIGMNHSTAYNADGSVSAYGDPSCIMATSFRELNSPHRIEKGWLKGKSIANVKNAGNYTLSPLEVNNPSEKQVLVVDVNMINYNKPESYYLSYRAPIGPFDLGLPLSVANRLSIHTWSGQNSVVTRFVGTIGTGETFTHLENGVEFTNTGIQNEVMTVAINFL